MIWLLVVLYTTPGGDSLMRSYHEFKTQEECLREAERAKSYPHPYGLKIELTCKQGTVRIQN